MFERNKIDNIEHSGIPVEITTVTGDVVAGRLLVAMGRTLVDTLNNPAGFIEFEPWGGDREFMAKSGIRNLKLVQAPKPESLKARVATLDGFDPWGVLGVKAGADLDEVKAAWHRLSKAYHPDRYATAELPAEVVDYLAGMARRVNAAYAALEGPLALKKRAATMRQAPVYESRPRA